MRKWLLCVLALINFSTAHAEGAWHGRIIHVATQSTLAIEALTAKLRQYHTIILGEKHNTPAIQMAESLIIDHTVKAAQQEAHFVTAWEFLNYTDQDKIHLAYERFRMNHLSAADFLEVTQGNTQNADYIPILETIKALQGQLIGVNLPREAKKPVTTGGIEAVDPRYLPPDFAMGSAGYHQRFMDSMANHAPVDILENYYAAQCLTDDVMAYTLQQQADTPLLFLITGSFHTDYHDGVAARLLARLPDNNQVIVRLIDASDYNETELYAVLHDKTYGDLADYIYVVNEPTG